MVIGDSPILAMLNVDTMFGKLDVLLPPVWLLLPVSTIAPKSTSTGVSCRNGLWLTSVPVRETGKRVEKLGTALVVKRVSAVLLTPGVMLPKLALPAFVTVAYTDPSAQTVKTSI